MVFELRYGHPSAKVFSSPKPAITPARCHEGTLTPNHDTATGERGYHKASYKNKSHIQTQAVDRSWYGVSSLLGLVEEASTFDL